jgi:zinc D-Ala-D-Ala carboxypeptidase
MRLGIDNVPTDEEILNNIRRLCINVLQPLRNKFGRIRITSGYRCLELNRSIGSGDSSNHVKGLAVDIEPLAKRVSLMDMLSYIHNNMEYKELISEFFPDGWVHVAYQEGNNKRDLKLKDSDHHYSRVDLDYIKSIHLTQ